MSASIRVGVKSGTHPSREVGSVDRRYVRSVVTRPEGRWTRDNARQQVGRCARGQLGSVGGGEENRNAGYEASGHDVRERLPCFNRGPVPHYGVWQVTLRATRRVIGRERCGGDTYVRAGERAQAGRRGSAQETMNAGT